MTGTVADSFLIGSVKKVFCEPTMIGWAERWKQQFCADYVFYQKPDGHDGLLFQKGDLHRPC